MSANMHPDRAPVPGDAAPPATEPKAQAPPAARPAGEGGIPAGALVITKPQAAGLVQVDLRTFERWEAANRVPGRVRLPGRSVRYLKDVIVRWVLEGCPRPEQSRKTGR